MNKVIHHARNKKRYSAVETIPEDFLEKIACPLCRSKNFRKVYPQHYPRLVACRKCQLIYTNPRIKTGHLHKLYTKTYFKNQNSSVFGYDNYLADEARIRQTARRRLQKIMTYKKSGRLLDLGCAVGFFLDEARKENWQVNGVEISQFASEYARKKLKLPVITADLLRASFPMKSFDVITLWDVIEHVSQPEKLLKKVHSWLKNDGLLVFSTPDVGSLPARLTGHRWIGYKLSDEHLVYFSLETITAFLEKTGFEITTYHHLGKHVSFELFANRVKIYSNLIGKLLIYLNKFIPKRFSFYMSAFDIICIYARKKKS